MKKIILLYFVFFLSFGNILAKEISLSKFFPNSHKITFLKGFVSEHYSKNKEYELLEGRIKNKKISLIKYKKKDKGIVITLDSFVLKDIFPLLKDISVLNDVSIDKVTFLKNSKVVSLNLNKQEIKIIKTNNNKDSVFVYVKELLASSFIPYTKGTLIDKVSLENILFVIQKKAKTLSTNDIPSFLKDKINKDHKSFDVKEGLNVFSTIDFKASSSFKETLSMLSINQTSFPLEGVLSKDTFKSFNLSSKGSKKEKKKEKKTKLSEKEKKSFLSKLSLNVTLPQLPLKKFSNLLSSNSKSKMKIQNKEEKKKDRFWKRSSSFSSSKNKENKSSSLSIDLSFPLNFKLKGFTQKLDSNIDFSTGNTKSISIVSLLDNGWKNPLDMKKLNIKQGAFKIDLDSSKKIELNFIGMADFKKLKNTGVDISFSSNKGSFSIDKIALSNNFKLSSLLDGNYYKFFDKFVINTVSRTKESLFIQGHLNGKKVSFIKDKDKNEVHIKLEDFVVADLFPQAASIPKLNNFALEELIMTDKTIEAHILINKKIVKIIKDKNSKADDALAIYFSSIKSSMFIPSSAASLADNLSLDNVLFLVSNKEHILKISDLPGSLSLDMKSYPSSEIQLFEGINIMANLDLKTSEDLAATLSYFGVNSTSLALKGTLSKKSFKLFSFSSSNDKKDKKDKKAKKEKKEKVSKKEKSSILSSLSLNIALPKLTIPKFDTAFDIKGPSSFNINGSSNKDPFWSSYKNNSTSNTSTTITNDKQAEKKSSSGLSFSIDMNLNLKAFSFPSALPAKISFSGGKDKSISLVSLQNSKWDNPFNIPGININKGAFVLDLHKDSPSEIEFFGFSDFASKKDIFMALDLSFDKGKISLKSFKLDGKFSLADIKGGSNIPFASKFSLSSLKLSASGIEAKTLFSGIKSDIFFFDTKEGSNFVISQDKFSFASLLDGVKNIPLLNKINLSNVGVIFSQNGMNLKSGELPPIAQDMLSKMFKGLKSEINIPGGISLLTKFSPSAFGVIGEGLKGLGVGDNSILVGELKGVFGGESAFNLDIIMDKRNVSGGLPNKILHLPKMQSPIIL